jgi:hypothetical protein
VENRGSQAGQHVGERFEGYRLGNGRVSHLPSPMPRVVAVTGSGGIAATVIVTVRRGFVWVSIMPPFTWEAILDPGKVDELVRTLTSAGKDVRDQV